MMRTVEPHAWRLSAKATRGRRHSAGTGTRGICDGLANLRMRFAPLRPEPRRQQAQCQLGGGPATTRQQGAWGGRCLNPPPLCSAIARVPHPEWRRPRRTADGAERHTERDATTRLDEGDRPVRRGDATTVSGTERHWHRLCRHKHQPCRGTPGSTQHRGGRQPDDPRDSPIRVRLVPVQPLHRPCRAGLSAHPRRRRWSPRRPREPHVRDTPPRIDSEAGGAGPVAPGDWAMPADAGCLAFPRAHRYRCRRAAARRGRGQPTLRCMRIPAAIRVAHPRPQFLAIARYPTPRNSTHPRPEAPQPPRLFS